MIKFQILNVIRRKSAVIPTTRYKYGEKGEIEPTVSVGAEWEEIEFTVVLDKKPTIQISNVMGSVFLAGHTGKLILNDPDLFGTFKSGDVIDFMPAVIRDTERPPENHQLTTSDTEAHEEASEVKVN